MVIFSGLHTINLLIKDGWLLARFSLFKIRRWVIELNIFLAHYSFFVSINHELICLGFVLSFFAFSASLLGGSLRFKGGGRLTSLDVVTPENGTEIALFKRESKASQNEKKAKKNPRGG